MVSTVLLWFNFKLRPSQGKVSPFPWGRWEGIGSICMYISISIGKSLHFLKQHMLPVPQDRTERSKNLFVSCSAIKRTSKKNQSVSIKCKSFIIFIFLLSYSWYICCYFVILFIYLLNQSFIYLFIENYFNLSNKAVRIVINVETLLGQNLNRLQLYLTLFRILSWLCLNITLYWGWICS